MKNRLKIILFFASFLFCTQTNAQNGAFLSLDGINDYMSVADHDDLDINAGDDYTVTCWVRTQSTSTYYWIVNKRGGTSADDAGYDLITNINVGTFGINLRTTTGATGGPPFGSTGIADGNWHHLAMVVNIADQTAKIYVDGVEDQSNTYNGFGTESFENNLPFQVGTNGNQSVFWEGDIDELRLWSSLFSENELMDDMTAIVDGSEANLLAAWDFENVVDNIASDLSGSHDGEIFGQEVINPGDSKIVFNSVPRSLQLYPRDENNEAEIEIAGTVVVPNMNSVVISLYRDDILQEQEAIALTYNSDKASFSTTKTIQSELALYDIVIDLDSQNVSLAVMDIQDIVAGDAYIVQGQSNAWASDYDNMRVMSRCNLPGHEYDFCHYHFEGYETMAFWIYRQLSTDFFGASFPVNVDPPNLLQATYASPAHDQVALIFDQPVEWNPSQVFGNTTYFLRDHIYLDGNFGMIENGSASGDTIFLNLSSSGSFENVSYTPNKFYNGTNNTYEGPWITGENGIGALTFFEVPVDTAYLIAVFEIDQSSSFEIFPNPTDSVLKMTIELEEQKAIEVKLLNTTGEEVINILNRKMPTGTHQLTEDIRMLPAGVYFLKVEVDDVVEVRKVLLI